MILDMFSVFFFCFFISLCLLDFPLDFLLLHFGWRFSLGTILGVDLVESWISGRVFHF